MNSMHSALPWHAHTDNNPEYIDIDSGCTRICSIDISNDAIAGIAHDLDDPHDTPDNELSERRANAAIIVQAVNHHAELVDRLESLMQWVDSCFSEYADVEVCSNARATLAKVLKRF